jgi:hypothetical protein
MSTLKTIDLMLGVPPNSIQEASATSLADYFQTTPQAEPRFTTLPQQVPFAINPAASAAQNPQQAQAAALQRDIPAGLDRGGQSLQEVLRLAHDGAAAAGAPGVPVLRDEVEHRLASGSPAPLSLDLAADGPCPLAEGPPAPDDGDGTDDQAGTDGGAPGGQAAAVEPAGTRAGAEGSQRRAFATGAPVLAVAGLVLLALAVRRRARRSRFLVP